MGWMSTHIEFLPAGAEADGHIEVEVELEYDHQPYEPAVMDVNSPFSGPGCDADADLIVESIKRSDGVDVCPALVAAVQEWWNTHGREEAIEIAEEARVSRCSRLRHDY